MQVLGAARTLIQIVRVEWSKESRGGPLATLRNSVPLALPFVAEGFEAGAAMWIEQHNFGEPDFAPSRRLRRPDKRGDFHIDGLVVRHLASATSVAGTPRCGAPQRHASIQYELQDGQWARLRWNGRHVDFDNGTWSYEQITLGIARVQGDFSPEIFLSTEPTRSFESLAMLR